jgi:hypothetical protein
MAPAAPVVRVAAVLTALLLVLIVGRGLLFDSHVVDVETLERDPAPTGPRDLAPYDGLGTWVDAFDYGPAYQTDGREPAVSPDDVEAMADAGVRTVYLQVNRDDERSPDGIVDRDLVAEFLVEAHARDMDVVGWYLPTFRSVAVDLGHLQDLLDFEVDGQRLDGVAVDIEYTEGVPDVDVRNRRFVRMSQRLAAAAGTDPIGAIVLPPVLTEVVNPDFWPEFPWSEIVDHYDVWLPMAYWTLRTEDSGYLDGGTYLDESIRRMEANLDRDDLVIHGIGGIGDETTGEDLLAFVETLAATDAVGGSIYDWATLDQDDQLLLRRLFDDYPQVG